MYDAGSMNLRSLKIFIAVLKPKIFPWSRAASPPPRRFRALSTSLRTHSASSFYRNTRAVIPTESGHLFIRYAGEMMTSFEEARRELDARSTEPSGTIRINAPVFSASGIARAAV